MTACCIVYTEPMATSTLLRPPVAEVPANPACPHCSGTGTDPTFLCACVCTAAVGRSARQEAIRAQLGDDGRERKARTGGGAGGGKADPNKFTNLYAGTCIKCNTHVAANAGYRTRDGQRWAVQHKLGECVEAVVAPIVAAPVAPSAPVEYTGRRNKYAASCTKCGQKVAAGEGTLENVDGKWLSSHIGGCPVVEVKVDALDLRPLKPFASRGIVRFGVPGVDTRLKIQVNFHKNGVIYVNDGAEYGFRQDYGQQNGSAYVGKVEAELRAILADPKAAAVKYGELFGHCACCNRPIENEESIERGMGPVCWGRFGG